MNEPAPQPPSGIPTGVMHHPTRTGRPNTGRSTNPTLLSPFDHTPPPHPRHNGRTTPRCGPRPPTPHPQPRGLPNPPLPRHSPPHFRRARKGVASALVHHIRENLPPVGDRASKPGRGLHRSGDPRPGVWLVAVNDLTVDDVDREIAQAVLGYADGCGTYGHAT